LKNVLRLCLHSRDVTTWVCLVLNVSVRSCFHNMSLPSQPLFVTCKHVFEGQCVYMSISLIAWAVHFQFGSKVWYGLNKLLKTWCCCVLHVVNTTIRSGRLCNRSRIRKKYVDFKISLLSFKLNWQLGPKPSTN